MFAKDDYILHWILLLLGNPSQSTILFAEPFFTEFGELLFYSQNIAKLSLTSKVVHFAKKAF